MQPRLIKNNKVDYQQVAWSGENQSGYRPVGDRVLILPDEAKQKTTGGIFVTDEMLERLNLASVSGTLIAVGDEAFKWNSDRTRAFDGEKPQPGDHIYYEKFAGLVMTGTDGQQYRLCDDKVVGAVEIH